ncbi:MAG TPA: hypothetical protein VHF47_14630 [Acidimicrobiales bacterium]|nr:hypothetical protein [Acidimicrobiales bacterium]
MTALRRAAVAAVVAVLVVPGCDGEPAVTDAVPGLSVLSLLAEVPEHGRYAVHIPGERPTHPAREERGRFWRVGDDVVTRADPFDEGTVRQEVARLRRRIDAMVREAEESTDTTDMPPQALFLLSENRYDGRDFQYDLLSLVKAAMGPLAEPVNPLIGRAREACGRALEAHRARVERSVVRLRPAFRREADGREAWTIETEPLGKDAEQTRREAVRACGADEDTSTPTACALRIERTATTVSLHLLPYCSFDPADRERPFFAVTAERAAVGPRPSHLEPVSAFDPVSRFLLKVSQCGGLPWEYSDFAAADTYTPPDHEDYLGPTYFVSEYLCEAEVPADRREEARREGS